MNRTAAAALLLAFSACSSPDGGGSDAVYGTYEEHVARMKTVELEAGTLAYVDEGEGEPVVLVHGIPTSSWMYRKVIAELVAKGHRVIAPDLMGMGASERLSDCSALSIERQAEYLAALLCDELQLEPWTHVAHDFGGPITWRMMEDPRCTIRSLVILDTFAFQDGWSPDLNCITKTAVELGTSEPFDDLFYKMAISGMVGDDAVATSRMLHGYCRPLVEGADITYKCLYFASNRIVEDLPTFQETLARYRGTNVKILWGRLDEFLSADEQVAQIKALLNVPDAGVVILEDVGHLVAEEAPDEVVRCIESSLLR